jgi:hypothetical protein
VPVGGLSSLAVRGVRAGRQGVSRPSPHLGSPAVFRGVAVVGRGHREAHGYVAGYASDPDDPLSAHRRSSHGLDADALATAPTGCLGRSFLSAAAVAVAAVGV